MTRLKSFEIGFTLFSPLRAFIKINEWYWRFSGTSLISSPLRVYVYMYILLGLNIWKMVRKEIVRGTFSSLFPFGLNVFSVSLNSSLRQLKERRADESATNVNAPGPNLTYFEYGRFNKFCTIISVITKCDTTFTIALTLAAPWWTFRVQYVYFILYLQIYWT
jgi:hypothetical protein